MCGDSVSAAPAIRETDEPLSIRDAAVVLGVVPSTVRRWVQRGAPSVRPGEGGPGRGALVRIRELESWRRGSADYGLALERVADALLEVHQRDAGCGVSAHKQYGVDEEASAFQLLQVWDRVYRKLAGQDLDEFYELDEAALPDSIAQLLRIWKARIRARI